jgi:micrococcal nuclease
VAPFRPVRGEWLLRIACVSVLTLGLAACAEPGGEESPRQQGVRVTNVVDGDTVDTDRLGRVRLIGVDTPEERQCYESQAERFTRARLLDKVVQYELGAQREDRYGRTLAYLTRDGQMHNEALLREGYAKVAIFPPNDKYERRFEAAQGEARTTDVGLWDTCDRDKLRARRAAEQRRERRARLRRIAARERARARRARAASRRQLRRERAAARRRQEQALDESTPPPSDESSGGSSGGDSGGGGGGSCLPSSACPGKRDGDGDGCYCE